MDGATRRRWFTSQVPALAVLLMGWTLTAAVSWQLDRTIEAKDHERFVNAVDRLQDAIVRRLATYTDMLRAGTGMMDVAGPFDRERFSRFVHRLELATRYPGIQGVGFTQRIDPADLHRFVAAQQAVAPGFSVWPQRPRDEYHAIVHLEPLDARNRAAIGYDMFTDATRRAAMERARDTGQAAASGPVTLVQEIDENKQLGFLIYLPVYSSPGIPPTVEARRSSLRGFVYSPFRLGDLFEGVLGDQSARAGFTLVDAGDASQPLYRTSEPQHPVFTLDRQLDIWGREWRVTFFSLPALERSSNAELVPIAAWVGTAVTLLVAFLVGRQSAARLRLERAERRAREHAAEMERARAEAERVNRLKDEFLATLSHEMRTPLNAMLGWLQILEKGSVPDERRGEVMATIMRNGQIQSKLIDDLLDMSRIIAGRLRMETAPVRLDAVIEAAVTMVRAAADAKGVRVTTSFADVPPMIADPSRLQQVFSNLLSNAVKFSRPGGRVQAVLRAVPSGAEVEVSDEGVGIPPSFLPHVFEPFRQAHASTERAYSGLGLGLSIVKRMVEMHGGTVSAHSAGEGHGATFIVRLPIIPAPAAAEITEAVPQAPAAIDDAAADVG